MKTKKTTFRIEGIAKRVELEYHELQSGNVLIFLPKTVSGDEHNRGLLQPESNPITATDIKAGYILDNMHEFDLRYWQIEGEWATQMGRRAYRW